MIGGRQQRSNKGVKRTPYGTRSGKTRSGKSFRGVTKRNNVNKVNKVNKVNNVNNNKSVRTRKQRSNKGVKRTPYGKRSGKTRSGKKFR